MKTSKTTKHFTSESHIRQHFNQNEIIEKSEFKEESQATRHKSNRNTSNKPTGSRIRKKVLFAVKTPEFQLNWEHEKIEEP